jgi:hypothetical protein
MIEQEAKVKWQENFLNLKTTALSIKKRSDSTFYLAIDINTVATCQRETYNKIVALLRKLTHNYGAYVFLYTTHSTDQWVEWFLKSGVQFHSINENKRIAIPTQKPFYDLLIDHNAGFKEIYWHYLHDLLPLAIGFIQGHYDFNSMIPSASVVITPHTPTQRVEDINVSTYTRQHSIKITEEDMDRS